MVEELDTIEDVMLFTSIRALIQETSYVEEEERLPIERQHVHTSPLTGHAWLFEMLKPEKHPKKICKLFRMFRNHFLTLVCALKERNLLKNTKNVTVEEQVAMMLLKERNLLKNTGS